MELIRWLERRQEDLGESNIKFARRLGITPEYWGMLRAGQRGLSLRVFRAAWKAFPGHRNLICQLAASEPAGLAS